MGCRSDGSERSGIQLFYQQTAKNLIYTLKSLDKNVPKWVLKIAEDYYADDPQDKLTPMLCGLIKGMSESQLNKIVYDGRKQEARNLAVWWENHQESDRRRESDEAEEALNAKSSKLRKSALKKLTKEEKKALGITSEG